MCVCVMGGCSEPVELDCVDEIIARCEARAKSLLAGTIFDDVSAPASRR